MHTKASIALLLLENMWNTTLGKVFEKCSGFQAWYDIWLTQHLRFPKAVEEGVSMKGLT